MQIFCPQPILNQNLNLVSRAVPSRPTHPILANILLEADSEAGTVTLTGFDLDLGIETRFEASVEGSGRTTSRRGCSPTSSRAFPTKIWPSP